MNDTIQHFGVKGMKWGQRNRVEHLTNRYLSKGYDPHTAYNKAVRRSNVERRLKKAAIVGGVALAAYAGYKGANYLMAKKKMDAVKSGLDTMNQIRESNILPKKGKMDRIREASSKLKEKAINLKTNNANKLKEASAKLKEKRDAVKGVGKKFTDRVKEVHRQDTERFASRMREAAEKQAAKQAQKASKLKDKKSLGQKLKDISTNFKTINKKVGKQTASMDTANSNALKMLKELQSIKR